MPKGPVRKIDWPLLSREVTSLIRGSRPKMAVESKGISGKWPKSGSGGGVCLGKILSVSLVSVGRVSNWFRVSSGVLVFFFFWGIGGLLVTFERMVIGNT